MIQSLTVHTEVMHLRKFSPPFHHHYPSGHVTAQNTKGSFEQGFSETVTDGLALQIRQHMQNTNEHYIMDFIHSVSIYIYLYYSTGEND